MKNKHVIILSHRRSGTHLTIDSIYNNFKYLRSKPYITLDETKFLLKKPVSIEKFKKQLEDKPRIIKSHYLPNFSNYYKNQNEINWVNGLFQNAHIIYVYRNGLDVMVSLYEYAKSFNPKFKNVAFSEFLLSKNDFDPKTNHLNRMEFWAYHIDQWQKSKFHHKILYIKYEDLINHYEETLGKISLHINAGLGKEVKDIRIKQTKPLLRAIKTSWNLLKGIRKTSVSTRKGKIGDSKNYFSEKDRELFFHYNKEMMQRLNY